MMCLLLKSPSGFDLIIVSHFWDLSSYKFGMVSAFAKANYKQYIKSIPKVCDDQDEFNAGIPAFI
jgi:hypothetical protein